MAVVLLECATCSKQFKRNKSEYKRSQKLGRPSFCSRTCSGANNIKNFDEYYQSGGKRHTEHLDPANRRDKHSPFKWFMRVVKRRNKTKGKEFDIDLEFLSNLWEAQSGVCPFTGWELKLPFHSTDWDKDDDKLKRASLDRIDNSKGYTKGNLRFVSLMANYCRNEFTDEDVKLFCEAVTSCKKVDICS